MQKNNLEIFMVKKLWYGVYKGYLITLFNNLIIK